MVDATKFKVMERFKLEKILEDTDQIGRVRSLQRPVIARAASSPFDTVKLAIERREARLVEPVRIKSNSIQYASWSSLEHVSTSELARRHSAAVQVERDKNVDTNGQLKQAVLSSPSKIATSAKFSPIKDEEEDKELDDVPVDEKSPNNCLIRRPLPSFSSPFTESILRLQEKSPFDRPVFGHLRPRDLSFCLEDAYCPVNEVLRCLTLKFTSSDVLVCSPLRTGQTPILKALISLYRGDRAVFGDSNIMRECVGFPGSRLAALPAKQVARGIRLFKTHVNLRSFVREEEASQHNAPKIIIPLRDPCRVVESWFRHLVAVYESVQGTSFPYGQSDFKSFCPGAVNPAHYQEGEDFEKFIANALSIAHLPNVCIVFYEDMMTRPDVVVEKLAKFLKLDTSRVQAIAHALQRDYEAEGLRLAPVFSDEFLAHRERRWCDMVQYRQATFGGAATGVRGLRNYYELYDILNGREGLSYPVPKFERTIEQSKPRISDLIFFRHSLPTKS